MFVVYIVFVSLYYNQCKFAKGSIIAIWITCIGCFIIFLFAFVVNYICIKLDSRHYNKIIRKLKDFDIRVERREKNSKKKFLLKVHDDTTTEEANEELINN